MTTCKHCIGCPMRWTDCSAPGCPGLWCPSCGQGCDLHMTRSGTCGTVIAEIRVAGIRTRSLGGAEYGAWPLKAVDDREDLLSEVDRLNVVIQRVRDVHTEYRIYGECDHDHTLEDVENGVAIDVEDVGPTCSDGLQATVCRECCTENGYQRNECADWHEWHHGPAGYHCRTANAITGRLPHNKDSAS